MVNRPGPGGRSAPWLSLAWGLALAAGDVFAQGSSPTVAATLLDPVADVGEGTEYTLTVVNGRADSPPPVPVVAGLTFQYLGEETHGNYYFDSRTGMRSLNSLVYRYAIRAAQPGRYVIPGQEVTVGGTALRTLPLTLTVEGSSANGAPPPSQTVSSELLIPKKSAYVGESIPIEVRSYFGTEVRGHPDPDPILTGEGFSVQKFTAPLIGPQIRDGVHYNTAAYKSAIAGLKIGELTIGPAETEPIVRLPVPASRRRRGGGGYDPFVGIFQRGEPGTGATGQDSYRPGAGGNQAAAARQAGGFFGRHRRVQARRGNRAAPGAGG